MSYIVIGARHNDEECKEVNKDTEPGTEWASFRGLLAPFSGEALPDVEEALG